METPSTWPPLLPASCLRSLLNLKVEGVPVSCHIIVRLRKFVQQQSTGHCETAIRSRSCDKYSTAVVERAYTKVLRAVVKVCKSHYKGKYANVTASNAACRTCDVSPRSYPPLPLVPYGHPCHLVPPLSTLFWRPKTSFAPQVTEGGTAGEPDDKRKGRSDTQPLCLSRTPGGAAEVGNARNTRGHWGGT